MLFRICQSNKHRNIRAELVVPRKSSQLGSAGTKMIYLPASVSRKIPELLKLGRPCERFSPEIGAKSLKIWCHKQVCQESQPDLRAPFFACGTFLENCNSCLAPRIAASGRSCSAAMGRAHAWVPHVLHVYSGLNIAESSVLKWHAIRGSVSIFGSSVFPIACYKSISCFPNILHHLDQWAMWSSISSLHLLSLYLLKSSHRPAAGSASCFSFEEMENRLL